MDPDSGSKLNADPPNPQHRWKLLGMSDWLTFAVCFVTSMTSSHVLNNPVQERIQLTFGVVNSEGENILVHQAFVR